NNGGGVYPDTSESACRAELERYHSQLHEIATKAVAKFNSLPDEFRLPLVQFKRSRATAIWAFAMSELMQVFSEGEENGFPYLKRRFDTLEIHFAPNLVARVKKMNEAGFTANYLTRRIKAFHCTDQTELFVLM